MLKSQQHPALFNFQLRSSLMQATGFLFSRDTQPSQLQTGPSGDGLYFAWDNFHGFFTQMRQHSSCEPPCALVDMIQKTSHVFKRMRITESSHYRMRIIKL